MAAGVTRRRGRCNVLETSKARFIARGLGSMNRGKPHTFELSMGSSKPRRKEQVRGAYGEEQGVTNKAGNLDYWKRMVSAWQSLGTSEPGTMRLCVARSGVVPQPPASQINHLENVWAIFNCACMRSQPGSHSMTVLTVDLAGSLWGAPAAQTLNGAATVKKIVLNPVLIRLGSVAATVTTRLLVKNKLAIQSQTHLSRRQTSRCSSGFLFPFLESAVCKPPPKISDSRVCLD